MHCIDGCDMIDIEEDGYLDVRDCPMCGAPNAPIGHLGPRAHYTCRYCGIWYSHL